MLKQMKSKGRCALLSGIAYELGELCPLPAAEDDAAFGVSSYSIMNKELIEVTKETIRQALQRAKRDPDEVDAVLVVTESFKEFEGESTRAAQTSFQKARNIIWDAVSDVGIRGAPVFCSSFGGSGNFLQAIFMAKPMVELGGVGCLLVVCADKMSTGDTRFMSAAMAQAGDSVAACILSNESKDGADAYEVEFMNIVPFTFARNPGLLERMLADMYKTIKVVAEDCYISTKRQPSEYEWLVLSNFNVPNNRLYAKVLGFSEERTFMKNVGRTGHLPSCDHLVNLRDLAAETALKAGMPILFVVNGPISCGAISLVVH